MPNEFTKPLFYRDGSIAKIGDGVLLENGRVLATIKQFILTTNQLKEWGVEEHGVMFESESSGLLFISDQLLAESAIERA